MKRIIITKLSVLCIIFAFAAEPSGYYSAAEGNADNALRLALHNIIKNHTELSYTPGLWNLYQYSDTKSDGKIWDMYSTCDWTYGSDQCGNYSAVCDCYNREHSVPKSWFGEASPMVSDAFHIYPTDGKVNGQRSNFPFGEAANGVKCDGSNKALGRLGSSTFSGYSGTVFEPDNEYKGDFARTYFYMATCYADRSFMSGDGRVVFSYNGSGNLKTNLTTYAVNLFLKWHRNDPVSQKETDRNNAVFERQENRNPFIDHPELAEYIWGNMVGNVWGTVQSATENIADFRIEILPNPAADFISVNSTETNGNFNYQIFNVAGKIIATNKENFNTQINISSLESGIYFIKIKSNEKISVEKFIKK
jgi:endonuclease I